MNWKYRDFFRTQEQHHFVIAKKNNRVVGWGVCGKMDMKGLNGLAILNASAIPEFEEEILTAIIKHQICLAEDLFHVVENGKKKYNQHGRDRIAQFYSAGIP